jgi:Sulfotransferase family
VTLHFVHIGKTGGTAIKHALASRRLAYGNVRKAHRAPETPYGRIQLHRHRFRLGDVPHEDFVFFCVRDPIARFVSGFYGRLNKGQPRYYYEWSAMEREAFEAFPTPGRLAAALGGADLDERRRAEMAMRTIRHLGSLERPLGSPRQVQARLGQIVYIARQETLDRDWDQLKRLLELPADVELPSCSVRSNRRDPSLAPAIDEAGMQALRAWYARDYKLVNYCEQVRRWRGWGTGADDPEGAARLRRGIVRLRAMPAIVLPRPPRLPWQQRLR